MSPSVPPLAGHGGLAAAPSAHSQPDNNFPYITQGLTFRLPAAAEFPTQHGRRRGVSAPVSFPEERRYPKSPRGSLCPSPPSPSSHPSPKSCQDLPPWRAGLRCPRASCRVPAVSPGLAALPGQCRLPWQDPRLGKAAAKFWGSSKEGGGGEASCRPRQGWSRSPGGFPEGSRRVPGALPARSRRAGTEALAPAGLPTQEICPSCLQLPASAAFRAVTQNPPRPRAGIFTRLQPHTLPVP